MKNTALGLVALLSLLSLSAACAAPTTDEEGRQGSVSSAVMTNGGNIPCHFTTAGCAGEGPDGFSQDPANNGGGGGGGGYAAAPADPGRGQAYARCANQCWSTSLYVSDSYGACRQACSATGARFVRHLPGVGFVGDGSPYDPTNAGTCFSGCAGEVTLCISACDNGSPGLF